ncbi:MAG TPA: 3-oxoacyl-[acyl-carrier-protein] synthase III C-terminal domain-containing protein [Alphaproteobacteria bacterium]|nr:3-oxoacyl-[acyl-carrier-protein] synthase III C-terminal domain-containing protein [Alphaproteobacteria bacterium]
MSSIPRLLSLATAVPPHRLRQQDVRDAARTLFTADPERFERLLPVYDNAGIETRYSCVPLEWYLEPHGWRDRSRLFVEHGTDLLERAARACLAQAGLDPQAVDAIVAVSTSGIATPSLDALLIERLDMRRDIRRLPVFGLGCVGGVLGLARAADMARAAPGERVLFLVVELCGLTFRCRDQSKSNVIATALFGDGAAAALVSCEGDGPALGASGEHTWRNSLDVMGWRVRDDGFGVLFSRDIPAIVRYKYRATVESFLARHGLSIRDIEAFLCHPGGAKVLEAFEAVFEDAAADLGYSREVLREYGNMSAATVLFVLERAMTRAGLPRRSLLTSLGPGFTAGFLLVEAARAAAALPARSAA